MQQWYAQISALHCFEASDERHIELLQRRKIVVDVCHNLANLIRQKITLAEMRASGVRGILIYRSDFASDNNDQRMISWRDDTALLLSTKSRMNIVAAVIEATNFKSPAHFPSSK